MDYSKAGQVELQITDATQIEIVQNLADRDNEKQKENLIRWDLLILYY